MTIETEIQAAAQRFAAEIAGLVRNQVLGAFTSSPVTSIKRPAARNKPAARNTPKTCVAPDCDKPATGPRFSFTCSEHREAPKAQRQAWYATAKAGTGIPGANPVLAAPAKRGRVAAKKARRR